MDICFPDSELFYEWIQHLQQWKERVKFLLLKSEFRNDTFSTRDKHHQDDRLNRK